MQTRDRIAQSSVPATLRTLGDGWTLSLLAALLGPARRFSALEAELGIARSTLAARLRHLVDHGLVLGVPYCERPTRFDYTLTERGRELFPVLALAHAFDVEHASSRGGFVHAPAGDPPHALLAVAYCEACGERVHARDVEAAYGLEDAAPRRRAGSKPAPERRATRARSTRRPYRTARDVLEDAWASKVVAALFMGERRFSGLVDATQAAPNILSERLVRLGEANLVQHVDRAGTETPHYRLTPRGLALYPLVVALIAYGDALRGHPSLTLRHRCSAPLRVRVGCAACPDSHPEALRVLPTSVSFAMQADLCATPTPT